MTIANLAPANEILNRVAAEVGLAPVSDPYASTDSNFIQLKYLLNSAGEELSIAHQWEFLNKTFSFTTASTDTGSYDLPDDFLGMVQQTGWDKSTRTPLAGALSPQEWAYLEGRDMAKNTIYPKFRIQGGKFNLYPSPPPDGLQISVQYTSSKWVLLADGNTYGKETTTGGDTPLFDKTLITRYLKVKWLESKGFDSSKAQDDLNLMFEFLTGSDGGSSVLSLGGGSPNILLGYYNIPDTGYGL